MVVIVLVFGRSLIIFNFQIIQLIIVVYFSQTNQIYFRPFDKELVGLKIKFYRTFTFVPNNFICFLEIIAFQRLKTYNFTVQIIRILHIQISICNHKTHSPAAYEEWMCKIFNLWFNVTYHPYKSGLLYPLWTCISEEILAELRYIFDIWVLYLWFIIFL
jgi:hypothetical protein